jgi:hypothetical protein
MGGLGNQLFQIFATISYAIRMKKPFKFLDIQKLGSGDATIRYTYWHSFLSNIKSFLIKEYPVIQLLKEEGFSFHELPLYETNHMNILLYGYFQSYKYFQENDTMICKVIGIEKRKKEIMKKMDTTEESFHNTISMHFRIGDYKHLQHCHPILTCEYYEKALTYIQDEKKTNTYTNPDQKKTVFYFCEEEDHPDVLQKIQKLSMLFPNCLFVRGENTLEDWEQMLFMSLCHDNIIANSSFSWWGAYFNTQEDKIVCYPSTWFGPAIPHDTRDMYPESWIKIKV